MTKAQVKWATAHDWFVKMVRKDGQIGVVVRDEWSQNGRSTFYDYQELRRWAGY